MTAWCLKCIILRNTASKSIFVNAIFLTVRLANIPIFSRVNIPVNSVNKVRTCILTSNKNKQTQFRILQCSVSIMDVADYSRTITKTLEMFSFFWNDCQEKKLYLWKGLQLGIKIRYLEKSLLDRPDQMKDVWLLRTASRAAQTNQQINTNTSNHWGGEAIMLVFEVFKSRCLTTETSHATGWWC